VKRIAVVVFGLGLSAAFPAAATQYLAEQSGSVVRLEDTTTQTVVSIVPSVGNVVFEMKANGHDILRWPYASVDEFRAKPSLGQPAGRTSLLRERTKISV
jgi:hypothetical protein